MASNNSNVMQGTTPPQLLPPINNTEAILSTMLIELRRMNTLLGTLLSNTQTQEAVKALVSKRR